MKTFFGSDITLSQRGAENDAEQCLRDAMRETGLPETAFSVNVHEVPDIHKAWGWSVELASDT